MIILGLKSLIIQLKNAVFLQVAKRDCNILSNHSAIPSQGVKGFTFYVLWANQQMVRLYYSLESFLCGYPPFGWFQRTTKRTATNLEVMLKRKKHSHTCLTHTQKTHTFLPQSGQAAWTSRIRRRAALLALKARADEKAGVD